MTPRKGPKTMTAPITTSILIAAACLAGCASDPDDPTLTSTESALSSNTHTAFNFFVHKGLTKRQSAGIVGNLMQESSLNPKVKQFGGGPGRGIAQWSVGGRWDTSHRDNVTWYANQHARSRWTLGTQLAFIWYELHTVGGYGLSALRDTTTIKGATLVFMRDYEICGTCASTKRIDYAHQVYNAYASTAAAAPATPCYSPTLDAEVNVGVCVESPDDHGVYQCDGGDWVDAETTSNSCTELHSLQE
jgi:Phage tail lysozyme